MAPVVRTQQVRQAELPARRARDARIDAPAWGAHAAPFVDHSGTDRDDIQPRAGCCVRCD